MKKRVSVIFAILVFVFCVAGCQSGTDADIPVATGAPEREVTATPEATATPELTVTPEATATPKPTEQSGISHTGEKETDASIFKYSISERGVWIDGLKGEIGKELIIPKTIEGQPVWSIESADGDFAGIKTLERVVIPEGVIQLGAIMGYTFSKCTNLKEVVLPSTLEIMGEGIFSGCSSLESVVILEGATSLGNLMFENCSSLTSITLPESLTKCGGGVFMGCSSLKSIEIPWTWKVIGQ